ncbi:MAG: MoaF C-terminal domain-containing protein [Pseudomonadota bacterium]
MTEPTQQRPQLAQNIAGTLGFNRLPSTSALAGTTLALTLDNGDTARIAFGPDNSCDWRGLPGFSAPSGRAATDVVEAAPGVYFIDLLLSPDAPETVNVIADTTTRHALIVGTRMNAPVDRDTRLSQLFTAATIDGGAATGPAPAPTRELVNHRALYHYSPETTYEHIYINTKWYAYQCVKGARRGDCGCDPVSYYKIRDDLYVVTWREILIDIAVVFVYDMKAMRTTGKAWGLLGAPPQMRNAPAGAHIEMLQGADYPAGVELV